MAQFRTALVVGLALMATVSFASSSETKPSKARQSTATRREKLHRTLDNANVANETVHDAFLGLVSDGDSSSVPHLIRALRLFPDSEYEGKNVGLECTHRHCIDALERITGAKVGVSYSSWKTWWNNEHPDQAISGSNA